MTRFKQHIKNIRLSEYFLGKQQNCMAKKIYASTLNHLLYKDIHIVLPFPDKITCTDPFILEGKPNEDGNIIK